MTLVARDFVLLVISVVAAAAQDAGVVEGLARNPATGEAISGVAVTLRPARAARDAALSAASDENGRFQVIGLKAGEYELDCQKAGFIRYQQWLKVGAGTTKVDAKMPAGGRISGRVTFGPGQAAAGIPVEIRTRGGRPRYTTRSAADGGFVFDTLPSARYVLSAGGRGYRPAEGVAEEGVAMGWAPTTEAQPLPLKAGMELIGYELRLRAVPVHRIRGVLVNGDGEGLGGAKLELHGADSWFGAEAETQSRADGSFELAGVRAGDWSIRAEAVRDGVTLRGHAALFVSKSDVERVRLELSPPFVMEGFVQREEPRDKDGLRKLSGVTLLSVDGGARIGPVFHEQDGRLRIPAVYPGRYRIFPLGFIPEWYLDSVRLGEQEALKDAVELRPGSPPVQIVYRPQAGRVRGVVDRGEGAQVVLLPSEEALWDAQFIRSAKAGTGGQFEVGSLKPGEYLAFAFAEPQNFDELSDPALVRPLLTQGVRVVVRQGEASETKLRITAGGIW
jgi:Carboxypeptidase regulatory-like domain